MKQAKRLKGLENKKSLIGNERQNNIIIEDLEVESNKLTERNYADLSQKNSSQRTLPLIEDMNQKKSNDLYEIKQRKFRIKINRVPKPQYKSN